MTEIKLKRVYEDVENEDGFRILVDRLWPRGMRKDQLKYDLWAKNITPSPNLRKWFHDDIKSRWDDFVTMYQKELDGADEAKDFIKTVESHNIVTLLYASREPVYNHASILKAYLEKVLRKM
ncbi:DUF488 family protein [uncultured Dysgonomonas sp.]|nr:DUF488 family protein [uncultured Dysgonomonas sp.]